MNSVNNMNEPVCNLVAVAESPARRVTKINSQPLTVVKPHQANAFHDSTIQKYLNYGIVKRKKCNTCYPGGINNFIGL